MVFNFLQEGAAINVFCNQNDIDLHIVDAGVNFNFDSDSNLINHKIDYGTKSFLTQKAMCTDTFKLCLSKGQEVVKAIAINGTNIIGFGEMGIGNTSASSMIMSYLCNLSISCVGKELE